MKLAKAIEILDNIVASREYYRRSDDPEALKLGIKALERHRDRHQLTWNGMLQPLPGETPPTQPALSPEDKKKLRESPLGRP